jgi:hypothetical protein
MRPSDEARERAAETLARMAEILGLEGGIAAFFGGELELVRWYEPEERDYEQLTGAVCTHVPPVSAFKGLHRWHEKLLKACRNETQDGIWDREERAERTLEGFFDFMARNDGYMGAWTVDDLREMASWTEGDSWLKRIDVKWPVLSLAAGGEGR